MTAVNINSDIARALIASRLKGEKFDKHGMDAALTVVHLLFDAGIIKTDCPDECGGAG